MTRLIDADALLEKLNYQGRFCEDDEMYNLITNAPTVQREGWVSVEDRLPEVKTAVLMLVSCSNYFNIEEGQYCGNGEWSNCWFDTRNKNLYPVTHWQPLPAAPTDTE